MTNYRLLHGANASKLPNGAKARTLKEFVHDESEATHAREIARMNGRALQLPGDYANVASEAEPAIARISHGMWVCDCPTPDCGGIEFCWPDADLMWCVSCGNEDIGGKWRPVKLPYNRSKIEAALLERRFIQNRHWAPGESVAALKRETAAHTPAKAGG